MSAQTGLNLWLSELAMRWLARRFPYVPPAADPPHTVENLKGRYAKWEMIEGWAMIGFAVLLGWGAFEGLMRFVARPPSDPATGSRFVVGAPYAAWILPAIFLGLIAGMLPAAALVRAVLGGRAAEYEIYRGLKSGLDVRRARPWILTPFVLITVVMVWAFRAPCDRFTDEGLVGTGIGGFTETRRAWKDVKAVRALPPEPEETRPFYTVEFADGSTWSTRSFMSPEPPQDEAIVRFVLEKTGKTLQD